MYLLSSVFTTMDCRHRRNLSVNLSLPSLVNKTQRYYLSPVGAEAHHWPRVNMLAEDHGLRTTSAWTGGHHLMMQNNISPGEIHHPPGKSPTYLNRRPGLLLQAKTSIKNPNWVLSHCKTIQSDRLDHCPSPFWPKSHLLRLSIDYWFID